MYIVKSLRSKGTTVETRKDGQAKFIRIEGTGTCESDTVTKDIVTQFNLGYITFWLKEEREPAPKPAPKPVPSEEQYYSFDELKKMKKAELVELLEQYELPIDVDQTKAEILEDLESVLKSFDIPKG